MPNEETLVKTEPKDPEEISDPKERVEFPDSPDHADRTDWRERKVVSAARDPENEETPEFLVTKDDQEVSELSVTTVSLECLDSVVMRVKKDLKV